MNNLIEMVENKFIYVPFFTWLAIQTFKVIVDLIKEKKFNFKRILGAGGMPSSHSAVVCVLAVMIGREYGFESGIFGLAVIFAMVVMYDAAGVRRAAGKQARLLNQLMETPGLSNIQVQEKLIEVLGHSPIQVFVGAIIGMIVGFIVIL